MFKHLLAALVLITPAHAQLLASYDAGTAGNPPLAPDPLTLGWVAEDNSAGTVVHVPVSPDPVVPTLNAWKIRDGVTTTGVCRLVTTFTPADVAGATADGWLYSMNIRMITGPSNCVHFEFATGTASTDDRYLLWIRISGSDIVIDDLLAGAVHNVPGGFDGAYHEIAMRKPSGASNQTADILFDGAVVGQITPSSSSGFSVAGGVAWGAGSSPGMGQANWNRVTFTRNVDAAEACSGDGGDQMGCTDCPCGNNALPGSIGGCINSAGTATRLIGSGSGSIAASDLRFEASGAPPSNSCQLTSGNALAPANMANPCFGLDSGIQSVNLDGLRCAVQQVLRHGVRPSDANGDVGVTTGGWGTPNGFFNFAAFTSGSTKHFQIVHRDDDAAVCQTGQNTSQAISTTFTP